ncbi:trans-resveratrol di-O-methyltransferase-like [Diospyros lotus]|uniref:trans-resveratrol di-O-methyltransferase-like n=1 Tax=Diospyros lotus TaxID=55363 RepID=UPI002259AE1E|nr:trans-resveratrol di-O-methyltransferase-like [Diospyros lotus]
MEPNSGQAASESFRAQALIYKHALNYGTSFCLSFAIQLGIPDVIHRHAQPMTLPELVSALQLSPEKTIPLRRVMALLVHSGFFSVNFNKEQKEEYSLTPSSRLLLRGELSSLSPFVQVLVHPVLSNPWRFLGDWFRGCKEQTVFETAHGVGLWDYGGKDPGFNGLFNEGMASDSRMMRLVVGDCKEIFEGVNSLVDVGGGTGNVAKIILQAFPHIKCTVFDLPHVVSGQPEDTNLSYVGGDLFESIPPADAILFKHVMHNWSDEECLKILKKCRESIAKKKDAGKVIIIDMVVDMQGDDADITETKLLFDILMMVLTTGRERNEREWEKMFLEAGFTSYKITPIFGLRSIIEAFP